MVGPYFGTSLRVYAHGWVTTYMRYWEGTGGSSSWGARTNYNSTTPMDCTPNIRWSRYHHLHTDKVDVAYWKSIYPPNVLYIGVDDLNAASASGSASLSQSASGSASISPSVIASGSASESKSESASSSASLSPSASESSSESASPSPSAGAVIQGSVCWGHVTGVVETNIRTYSGNWTGTGAISGVGDAEIISLDSGEYMISEVVDTGARHVELDQNHYNPSGDNVTLKYRTGASKAACEAAAWTAYTVPFLSDGFAQVRIEV